MCSSDHRKRVDALAGDITTPVVVCPNGPRIHPMLPTCSSNHMRAQLAMQKTFWPLAVWHLVPMIGTIRAWLAARGEPEQ